jgi:hypothetical protein
MVVKSPAADRAAGLFALPVEKGTRLRQLP